MVGARPTPPPTRSTPSVLAPDSGVLTPESGARTGRRDQPVKVGTTTAGAAAGGSGSGGGGSWAQMLVSSSMVEPGVLTPPPSVRMALSDRPPPVEVAWLPLTVELDTVTP